MTPFEEAVYEAVRRVPAGRVTTYKLIVKAVGRGHPRAVGQALRKNPFAPRVPCHRVVRSDLSLGGFKGVAAGAAVAEKESMLRAEGVPFAASGRVAPSALFDPTINKGDAPATG